MGRKQEAQIKRIFQNFSKQLEGNVTEIVQLATKETYDYIDSISPIYTGSYASNNQVIIKGVRPASPNVATGNENRAAQKAGNAKAGPMGTPIGRFSGLISEANQRAHSTAESYFFPQTRRVTFLNNSPHSTNVEEGGGNTSPYEVYGQGATKFKQLIAAVKRQEGL